MRQRERLFLEGEHKILATDLDGTLLPNGSWEAHREAINLFNNLTEKRGVLGVQPVSRADNPLIYR